MLSGERLHLQHGPIDLVIGAEGQRDRAFAAARRRFATVLAELVSELPLLRRSVGEPVSGPVACRMVAACAPHRERVFVTPMAAVAGSVADEVLAAMLAEAELTRAYINNGGDIALHLAQDSRYRAAIARPDGVGLGMVEIAATHPVRGIATSGWRGRSFSLGIADAVTVLARSGAEADVAATLIGNAVDLPGHPAVRRSPAQDVDPDSDLGRRLVTTHVGRLSRAETASALERGVVAAAALLSAGHIQSAALFLGDQSRSLGEARLLPHKKVLLDA
jgi:ApbE superfamily uncharacterized protein (UPF0280 family)